METAYFITTIASLATVIVTLWRTNVKQTKKQIQQQQDNLLTITDALVRGAESNEHLANAIDTLPDRVTDKILASLNKKGG